jgi:hypothetical protein
VAVVVAATQGSWLPARLLGSRAMCWAGTRSYGIYLWHWPVYMLTRPGADVSFDGLPLMALRLATTLALAELSYRFVLTPVRGGVLTRIVHALRAGSAPRAWAGRGALASLVLPLGVLVTLLVTAAPARPPSYLAVESFQGVLAPPAEERVSRVSGRVATEVSDETPVAAADESPTPAAEEAPAEDTVTEPAAEEPPAAAAPPPPAVAPMASSRPAAWFAADVYAVGDSVMLGARTELARAGSVELDAAVGRQSGALPGLVAGRRAAGNMPPVVVIHLGNNGPFPRRDLDQALQSLEGVAQVILLTVKVDRPWEGANNAMLWSAAGAYPNVTVVDWHGASGGRPEYFYNDRTHLRPDGANAYAHLIAGAIRPPAPPPTPTSEPATPTPEPTPTPSPAATAPATPEATPTATASPSTTPAHSPTASPTVTMTPPPSTATPPPVTTTPPPATTTAPAVTATVPASPTSTPVAPATPNPLATASASPRASPAP